MRSPSSLRRAILIVDDDAGVRDLVRTYLTGAGFGVETARTGVEAVNKLRRWQPTAMVLDINMPELDGFGVLEALRNDMTLVPTLVLTARHGAEDVRRAIGLGAKDYLSKPFSEAQLLARVARLVRAPRRVELRAPAT